MKKTVEGKQVMGFVLAKCTNCGANLEVNPKLEAAICPYCNSAYIVEKAINNYSIGSINANVVNIYGNVSNDFVIRAGILEEYNGAAVDITIPDTVRELSGTAFRGMRGLNRIVLPDTVSEIPDGALSVNLKG